MNGIMHFKILQSKCMNKCQNHKHLINNMYLYINNDSFYQLLMILYNRKLNSNNKIMV